MKALSAAWQVLLNSKLCAAESSWCVELSFGAILVARNICEIRHWIQLIIWMIDGPSVTDAFQNENDFKFRTLKEFPFANFAGKPFLWYDFNLFRCFSLSLFLFYSKIVESSYNLIGRSTQNGRLQFIFPSHVAHAHTVPYILRWIHGWPNVK